MEAYVQVGIGILLPFFGTVLGACAVFLLRGKWGAMPAKALLGLAAGVMLAASVWSLLIPAVEMAEEQGVTGWLPAVGGFFAGVGFLLVLDGVTPYLHGKEQEGSKMEKKCSMLLFAVTLHNIPEGMAVGVVFAGFLADAEAVPLAAAYVLSVGIALQNIPEGAIVSAPLHDKQTSRGKAFRKGVLSGAVEPVGALVTLVLAWLITPILPYILSFAAGAMVYVVVQELIPEAQSGDRLGKDGAIGTVSIAVGFALMMALDVALG